MSINPWREAIDIPTRPAWSSSTSAAELHASESAYFTSYLQRLYSRYPVSRLNHFEHNLEVWRQLWRVCEQSHVLLLIVDCRYPLINFPPSLHHYVSVTLRKPLLLLLNKVDLIPRSAVQAWMAYFHRHYPTLHVVAYSSQSKGREGSSEHFDVLVRNRAKKPGGGQLLAEAFGVAQLLQAVRALVRSSQVEVDDEVKERFSFEPTNIQQAEGSASSSAHAGEQLTADARREDEEGEEAEDDGGDEGEDAEGSEREHLPTAAKKGKGKQKGRRGGRRRRQRPADGDGGAEEDEADASNDAVDYEEEQVEGTDEEPLPSQYRHLLGQLEEQPPSSSSLSGSASSSASASAGPPLSRSYLTLGTLGTPNAGKSSLINSLCRRKLVSVSKTPGHTKYLQTLFLNPHTRLCDCPGLVFPALDLPKAMQTLAGSFPIAQTRDPYSAVRLLAETVPLEKVYKLQPTPVDERGEYTYGDGEEGEAGWEWTAWSICEAFAYQKGYRNRHGALDLYRAANQLCRDALEGTTVMVHNSYTHATHTPHARHTVRSPRTDPRHHLRLLPCALLLLAVHHSAAGGRRRSKDKAGAGLATRQRGGVQRGREQRERRKECEQRPQHRTGSCSSGSGRGGGGGRARRRRSGHQPEGQKGQRQKTKEGGRRG